MFDCDASCDTVICKCELEEFQLKRTVTPAVSWLYSKYGKNSNTYEDEIKIKIFLQIIT